MTDMPAGEIFDVFSRIFGGRQKPFTLHSKTLSGAQVYNRACVSCRQAAKGRADCAMCKGGSYCSLSAEDIVCHINGRAAVGIYPSDENGFCRFSVIEIGGEAPAAVLRSLSEVCDSLSVDCLREVTEHGRAARLWIFFGRDVSPEAAVFAAVRIVEEALIASPNMPSSLFDGIYPYPVSGKGFGKPLVLPLFDISSGFSFFLDKNFEPAEDSLSLLKNFNPSEPDFSAFASPVFPDKITAEICGAIYLTAKDFNSCALAAVCRRACFINTECGEFSDAPSVVCCFSVAGGRIILPRCTDLHSLMPDTKIHIVDSGQRGRRISLRMRYGLNEWQSVGAEEALRHKHGIITAPVGSGKTLIICAVIERLGSSALILVPDKAAAVRWKRRLCEAFGLSGENIGCVIGERDFPNGLIDVAVMNDKTELLLAEYISLYGMAVVADCDRLKCTGEVFRGVMESICAERVYAISSRQAECARLKDYIRLYCGKTIYRL